MEYAVYTNRINIITKTILPIKKNSRITRIYFGEEFCEYKFPSLEEIKEAYSLAIKNNLRFTLVTGPVTNSKIENIVSSLQYLESQKSFIEIIFNDWGVFNIIKSFSRLTPVMGRMLVKINRMPRYSIHLPIPFSYLVTNENLWETQKNVLKDTNLSVEVYRQFLKRQGIKRIECDLVPQGINLNKEWGFYFSFYTPYSYITGGRTCEIAGIYQKYKSQFVTQEKCTQPCKNFYISFETNGYTLPLKQFGNSIFFENKKLVPVYLKSKIFNRCVIEFF